MSGSEARVAVAGQAIPTGNTYDKYGAANPIVRHLVAGFERDLLDLIDRAAPASIIDVGCGEGIVTERLAKRTGGRVVGVDLDDPKLRNEWQRRARPDLEFRSAFADELPFDD